MNLSNVQEMISAQTAGLKEKINRFLASNPNVDAPLQTMTAFIFKSTKVNVEKTTLMLYLLFLFPLVLLLSFMMNPYKLL